MLYDFLTKWGGWMAIAVMGLAFISTLFVAVIQPRNTFKWFLRSFSFIPGGFGVLCLLGGWQHLHKGDSHAARTVFIIGGVSLLAFVVITVLSFVVSSDKRSLESTSGDDACTNHARWISISGFVAFVMMGFAFFYSAKLGLTRYWEWWMFPLSFFLFFGTPAAILVFVLPPRCRSCSNGRMRLKGMRPAWYRCQSCGEVVRTHIMLGGRKGIGGD